MSGVKKLKWRYISKLGEDRTEEIYLMFLVKSNKKES